MERRRRNITDGLSARRGCLVCVLRHFLPCGFWYIHTKRLAVKYSADSICTVLYNGKWAGTDIYTESEAVPVVNVHGGTGLVESYPERGCFSWRCNCNV